MHQPCAGEAPQPCFNGCFPSHFLSSEDSHTTPNSRVNNVTRSKYDFVAATSSTLQPNTQFTNPEALPSLHESYTNFTRAYPPFSNTLKVDQIRAQEYYHLNLSNLCFDYTGYGLLSYAQQQGTCPTTSIASSSSSSPRPSLPYSALEPPFFDVSYKSVNLHSQVVYGGHESELESRIRERIMAFMNMSETEYTLVFTANQLSAFKLVADSFQFPSNGNLLTAYDHNSEALDEMIKSCKKQGAHILSAEFSWPDLRIQSRKLKKMILSKKEKRKRGLLVFPVHSRVTGAPYSYIWMSMAQENGWHVLLDACSLGPKEMDTLGLSLFKPDFLVCSFYKIFGENPSGFGCLFVKKSSVSAIKDSANATSVGIVSIVPAFRQSQFPEPDEETQPKPEMELQKDDSALPCTVSEPLSTQQIKIETCPPHLAEQVSVKQKEPSASDIVELDRAVESDQSRNRRLEIECRGLDHADAVGLIVISSRARYLVNWLVHALMSLQHPHVERGNSLIKIYGPKINSHRGPAVAFNVFDWKGEKIDPLIVQKLADRNNISLSYAYLQKVRFSDKNEEERERVLESRTCEVEGVPGLPKKTTTTKHDYGISVVTAAISFLTNFEDIYRLWAFLSRFLDADFVEKERWRYKALNQKTVEV